MMTESAHIHAYYVEDSLGDTDAVSQLIQIGKRLYERGTNVSVDGNLSIRLEEDRILLTRSGSHKGFLSPQDCIVVDLRGNVLKGEGRASSEFPMHAEIYKRRPDINAVIHAHAPHALACSVAGISLEKLWISVPMIPYTDYARPASQASAEVLAPVLEKFFWAILPRHGAVSWGRSLWEAFCRMESLEHTAKIVISAHSANASSQGLEALHAEELLAFWRKGS